LRRVYEERCRVLRTQELRRREGGGKAWFRVLGKMNQHKYLGRFGCVTESVEIL
jgi:hypothetical protein